MNLVGLLDYVLVSSYVDFMCYNSVPLLFYTFMDVKRGQRNNALLPLLIFFLWLLSFWTYLSTQQLFSIILLCICKGEVRALAKVFTPKVPHFSEWAYRSAHPLIDWHCQRPCDAALRTRKKQFFYSKICSQSLTSIPKTFTLWQWPQGHIAA